MATAEKKELLLGQIPRVKLWLVFLVTLVFSMVLLVASHLTHSLTLRIEAYHSLYNLLSLSGCLVTMKLCSRPQSLHNTFGWARLEVVSMLTTLLFLTALCFSVIIDAVQTAVHAVHQDAMHHPLSAMGLGAVGLCLNALVFCLIGGYTHHQGCFLEMRDAGSVWVGRRVTQEAVQAGRRMLSSNDLLASPSSRPNKARLVIKEVVRDVCGLVMVEICAALVYWDDGGILALFIDPALAVTTAALLIWLSYPFGKQCSQILLQTIPGHIDMADLESRVLAQFPDVVNMHHLHIWTFTPSKVIATAHVVFQSPQRYLATKDHLNDFFLKEGITHVTLQPECLKGGGGSESSREYPVCLLRCQQEGCHQRECCTSCSSSHPLLTDVAIHPVRRRCVHDGEGNGETSGGSSEEVNEAKEGGGAVVGGTQEEPHTHNSSEDLPVESLDHVSERSSGYVNRDEKYNEITSESAAAAGSTDSVNATARLVVESAGESAEFVGSVQQEVESEACLDQDMEDQTMDQGAQDLGANNCDKVAE